MRYNIIEPVYKAEICSRFKSLFSAIEKFSQS